MVCAAISKGLPRRGLVSFRQGHALLDLVHAYMLVDLNRYLKSNSCKCMRAYCAH